MNKFITILLTLFIITFSAQKSFSQSGQLIGGNIVNGAVTGAILGTATMGLQNNSDLAPLRIGLGAGLLGGAGLAIYDVATLPQGQQFFISGTFNDGTNTSIIILLDTVYGAGVGITVGAAVSLIGNSSFVDGIKYGVSAGSWVGFGYGLIDAFILAERNRDFLSNTPFNRSSLFELDAGFADIEIAKPTIYQTLSTGSNSLSYDLNPGIQLVSFKGTF